MTITINWINPTKTIESVSYIATTVGRLLIYQSNQTITRTSWDSESSESTLMDEGQNEIFQQYFKDPSYALNINLQRQGSVFRQTVWTEICKIPFGQVCSYSTLAKNINSGARAVANACRDNPYPGIIPCHRVVAVNGLGGYMGQTEGQFFEIKKKLLAIEASLIC